MDLIDPKFRVNVYRNLHTGTWSVRQKGKVICHPNKIVLRDVRYNVGKKGNERVRKEGRKNVHATISGYYIEKLPENVEFDVDPVFYNPYNNRTFVIAGSKPVLKSDYVVLDINATYRTLGLWLKK